MQWQVRVRGQMGKGQKRKKLASLRDLPPHTNPKPSSASSARRLQSEKGSENLQSQKGSENLQSQKGSEKRDLEAPQSPPSSKKMRAKIEESRPLGLDGVVCEKCFFLKQGVVCEKCGDRGFPETLVCCCICQNAFEHRYCFDNASDIFRKNVKWACPDCVDKMTKEINVNLPPRKSQRISSRNLKSEDAVRKSNAVSTTLPSRIVKSKKRYVGQNVKQLELPAEACLNELEGKDCSRSTEEAITTLNTITTLPTRIVKRKTRCGMGQNVKILELSDEVCLNKCEGKDCSSVETVTRQLSDVVLWKDPKVSLVATDNQSSDDQVHPNMNRVWMGTFSILNDKFTKVDGVVAYVLNDANTGVKDEASLLTTFLYPDFFPKSELWPKSLQEPSSHSIYFFSEKNRDEEVFSTLVNYLTRNDLSMRCEIDNRELLVFTEAALPQNFRRIDNEEFLWGVFNKKASSST